MQKVFAVFLSFVFIAASAFWGHETSSIAQEKKGSEPTPPKYDDLFYWVAHPSKWDYSDSTPAFLSNNSCDTAVDVFFLHPTSYIDDLLNAPINADLHDGTVNAQTDRIMLNQVSVFNHNCRVFAPRYRQAHLKAYFRYNSSASRKAFDLAYEDLKTAFQYYVDHWNHGRPIIIASHSQGSMHAIRLLKEFFDGKALQKQLVCAYVVGWRTYRKGHIDPLVKRENGNSLCVNPISWTTDNNWTTREMHKGAIGKDFNKLIAKKISVAIAPGANILWVDVPEVIDDKPGMSLLNNFHVADYNLFWMDIRENVQQRIQSYLKH